MRNRYTFFLQFRGGTFIRQIKAKTLLSSLKKWTKLLRSEPAPRNAKKISKAFFNDYVRNSGSQDSPTPLAGLKSVWFLLTLVQGYGADLNIVCSEGKKRSKKKKA